MKIIKTITAVRDHTRRRLAGTLSVLVPTMGALHRGHEALIQIARERAGQSGEVTLSIFVNPLQFEPGSDLQKYPRQPSDDERICRQAGVDLLFLPSVQEMYCEDRSAFVDETSLSRLLCGASRPGHFRGVCTVVAKLFHLLAPDAVVFGEKDYQQLLIVRRMARDLNFPIEIIGAPTVREPDGLALSSRNQYLKGEQRVEARLLYRSMMEARQLAQDGETSAETLTNRVRQILGSGKDTRIDYVSIVDSENLLPLTTVGPNTLLALAVFVGRTRLIDNVRLA